MSDLLNANRLRVSLRIIRADYAERFRWFQLTEFHSSDHGKPTHESNWVVQLLWMLLSVKWRPDGKRAVHSAGASHG